MALLRLSLLASLIVGIAPAADYFLYVGTYTGPESKGVYVYRFNPSSGEIKDLGLAGEAENPSFLAIHPSGDYLYSANEIDNGTVSAFRIDRKTGKLTLLNTVSSHGAGPCSLMVDPTGTNVLVANYNNGSVALLPLKADGSLAEASATDQHKGSGADKRRQRGPHAHSTDFAPGNRFALVSDLGLDKVFIYPFDARAHTLAVKDPAFGVLPPASGPRHLTFDPKGKFAYVVNELNSTVSTFAWDGAKGALNLINTISALPPDSKVETDGAEIQVHPNGRFVYASNRGKANNLAAFRIDPAKGTLTFLGNTPSGGVAPRNFGLDPTGAWLFAANQNTNNIVLFRVDPKTGKLKPSGKTIERSQPVCVKFVPAK